MNNVKFNFPMAQNPIFSKIKINRSVYLIPFVTAFYIATLFCIVLSAAPLFLQVIFSVTCIGFYVLFLYRHFLTDPIMDLFLPDSESNAQSWCLRNNQGEIYFAKLLASSYVSRFLIILNFKIENALFARSIILLQDSLDHSSFRKLTAYLSLKDKKQVGQMQLYYPSSGLRPPSPTRGEG